MAPGLDIDRDILAHMGFEPIIKGTPMIMDERLFNENPIGLRELMLTIPLVDRFSYDARANRFIVNFEGLIVRSITDVQRLHSHFESALAPIAMRVFAVFNYDNFTVMPEVLDDYLAMVKEVVERYYSGVTRYTTSSWLRSNLGEELENRGVAPYIFESRVEANEELALQEKHNSGNLLDVVRI